MRSSVDETQRVELLMDLAYTMAREGIAFNKFGVLAELQKRAGVKLGKTYLNKDAAKELTMTLGETMKDALKEELSSAEFVTVLVDGSTDCSVTEKELVYARFVNGIGHVCTKMIALKDVARANADGLLRVLSDSFIDAGLTDYTQKLVGFMSDGASVNFGSKSGLLTKLQTEAGMPWIVGIHCLNHRLELAVKDAFGKTPFDDICTLLNNIHSVFERSPKRLRTLQDVAAVLKESCRKPARSNGTRWIQHKVEAASIVLKQYGLIVSTLASITDDAKIVGYAKRLSSLKTLLFMQLFHTLLQPVSNLSKHMLGESVNLLQAQAALEAALITLQNGKETIYTGQLGEVVSAATEKLQSADGTDGTEVHIEFQSVTVNKLKEGMQDFESHATKLVNTLSTQITLRFSDILVQGQAKQSPVLGAIRVLDLKTWPKNKDDLQHFGEK